MMSGVLSQTNLAIFPILAFVIFASVFLGMLAWIFRPGARRVYETRARMALDSDDTQTSEGRRVQP